MKRVYVAGPFRGGNHWEIYNNIKDAEALALEVWKAGGAAFCPHLNTAHFQDVLPDEVWLRGDLEWVKVADAIIVVKDWERSAGTAAEIQYAVLAKKPVFYASVEESLKRFKEWLTS